ncbi:MAG TPA: HEAT repeat domain-containing protein [Polyangiaceae bacterium]|jgi:HEAT repeat protein|nr:HEAT repeat domain-containing protein [Polyangiaceae bacterium]
MSLPAAPQTWSAAELAKLAKVDRAVAAGEPAIPQLVAMLTEPSWVVRRGVVRGLAAMGDVAVSALLDVLRMRRDDETRIAATVDALAASTGYVEAKVVALVNDPDPAVVCDAVQVLGRRRVLSAVPLLRTLVDATDENVAVSAIEALGRIGGSAAVETLIAAATSNDFFRVFPAIDVLGRTGDPRAVAPLASLLSTPLYGLEAARSLARTGESSAVAPLVRFLSGRGDANMRTAAVALAELHDRAEERHGSPAAIVRALQALPDAAVVSRRLSHGFRDASPVEKVAMSVVLGSLGSQESVAILTELVDEPAPVGGAASRALARLSLDAQAELGRVLRDGSSAQRLAVLPLVTRAVDPALVDACLTDEDAEVRKAACDAVGRLAEPARVGVLFDRLDDPSATVVQAAISAIQSLGGVETEKRALALSASSAPSLRRSGVRILSYFGYPSSFEPLLAATLDPDARVREAALGGIALIDGEAATRVLLDAAGASSERTRRVAFKALGHRNAAPDVVEALVAGLDDVDAWSRYYAAQSLGRLAVHDAEATLERLLADPAGQVRVAAVEALSLLGGDRARTALLAASGSEDEDIRRAALVGLGMSRDPAALAALSSAAVAADAMTRLIAVSAIAAFDAPVVLDALVAATADIDDSVRTAALGCLAIRPGPLATAALVRILGTNEAPDRVVVALSSPAKGRVAGIVDALSTDSEELARQLVSALGRMGTDESTQALIGAMTNTSAAVRKAAAATLGALGSEASLETLRLAAAHDPDPEIRRVASLLSQS